MARASFRLTVCNDTGHEIFLRTGTSDYITFHDDSPAKLGATTPMPAASQIDLVFWIAGGHGTGPAWLALGASYSSAFVGGLTDFDDFRLHTPDDPPTYLRRHLRQASYETEFSYLRANDNEAHCVYRLKDAALRPANWPPHRPSRGKGPLELRYVSEFTRVWDDAGSGAVFDLAIFKPLAQSGFRNLGFLGVGPRNPLVDANSVRVALVARATDPTALADPVGFETIGSNHGSKSPSALSWWRPIPPAGYRALGTAFFPSYETPGLKEIACVREDLTAPAQGGRLLWSDRDSGGEGAVTLFDAVPSTAGGLVPGSMFATARHVRAKGGPKWEDSDGKLFVLKAAPPEANAPPMSLGGGRRPPAPPPGREGLWTWAQAGELAQLHGPVLHLHPEELYPPINVDAFAAMVQVDDERRVAVPLNLSAIIHPAVPPAGGTVKGPAYLFVRTVSEQFTDLQFWFFHAYRRGTVMFTKTSGVQDNYSDRLSNGEHVGDWQHVTLRFDTADRSLVAVCYNAQGEAIWYKPAFEPDGKKVRAYSALGTHGVYPTGIEHRQLFGWVRADEHFFFIPSDKELRFYTCNYCQDGGPSLDSSAAFVLTWLDGTYSLLGGWADGYSGYRWGPTKQNSDSVAIKIKGGMRADSYTFDTEDKGSATPAFAFE